MGRCKRLQRWLIVTDNSENNWRLLNKGQTAKGLKITITIIFFVVIALNFKPLTLLEGLQFQWFPTYAIQSLPRPMLIMLRIRKLEGYLPPKETWNILDHTNSCLKAEMQRLRKIVVWYAIFCVKIKMLISWSKAIKLITLIFWKSAWLLIVLLLMLLPKVA